MDSQSLCETIRKQIKDAKVSAAVEGSHCLVTVESAEFTGLNSVKRQQMIYKALHELITSGELHAVSLKTYAPGENK